MEQFDIEESEDPAAIRLWVPVRNATGRCSIWPADRPAPGGWQVVGAPAPRDRCLADVASMWVDERPAGVGALP